MHAVAVILPCMGRHEQTLAVAARLREQAGDVAQWIAVGSIGDTALLSGLSAAGWDTIAEPTQPTYWGALALATEASDAPVLCAVANDLWASPRWLELGLAAYRARLAEAGGLMGFAGDGHGPHHSCHFLIGRAFLAELGGWPTHYRHNFGDAELCERAQALGRYGKATRAVLEHRHVGRGLAPDDATYRAGRATWRQDEALYRERRPLWTR